MGALRFVNYICHTMRSWCFMIDDLINNSILNV